MNNILWIVFLVVIAGLLALDLGVLNRKPHEIKLKEALWTSLLWIGVSLAFNVLVFFTLGAQSGLEFFAGYIVEKALSVDNLFVFIVIFGFFGVLPKYQHRVLFWGILGAIVLRGLLILLGAALVERFEWIIYLFGLFLIYTAFRLATRDEAAVDPDKNVVVKLFRRFFPVTPNFDGAKFFTRIDGKLLATVLFIVLLVIETADIVFAFDSIPAIFAITTDPFIVFTSNIFAILGLRALYFLLADLLDSFRYLKPALAFILGFVGVKMLVQAVGIYVPILVSLGVIAAALALAIAASIYVSRRETRTQVKPAPAVSSAKGSE